VRAYGAFFGILALGLLPVVQVGAACNRTGADAARPSAHAQALRPAASAPSSGAERPSASGPWPLRLLDGAMCAALYRPAVPQDNRYADLPYFIGLAAMTIYVGAHRGLNSRQRQQISIKEGLLAPVLASGAAAAEASTAAAATAPRLHYCWGCGCGCGCGWVLIKRVALVKHCSPCCRRRSKTAPSFPPAFSCFLNPAASLFGLYLLLKFLPDLNLQTLLNAYFWLLGSISLIGAFGPTLRTLVSGSAGTVPGSTAASATTEGCRVPTGRGARVALRGGEGAPVPGREHRAARCSAAWSRCTSSQRALQPAQPRHASRHPQACSTALSSLLPRRARVWSSRCGASSCRGGCRWKTSGGRP
jgi:hypothetical protein